MKSQFGFGLNMVAVSETKIESFLSDYNNSSVKDPVLRVHSVPAFGKVTAVKASARLRGPISG
jgi:hypothetical protein